MCHCFAEAVSAANPLRNTASAKQWHTIVDDFSSSFAFPNVTYRHGLAQTDQPGEVPPVYPGAYPGEWIGDDGAHLRNAERPGAGPRAIGRGFGAVDRADTVGCCRHVSGQYDQLPRLHRQRTDDRRKSWAGHRGAVLGGSTGRANDRPDQRYDARRCVRSESRHERSDLCPTDVPCLYGGLCLHRRASDRDDSVVGYLCGDPTRRWHVSRVDR